MKTVYTLTDEQFKTLERIEATLLRDPSAPLGVVLRRGCASDLSKLLIDVTETVTQHVEPKDRALWQGAERRLADRRSTVDFADSEVNAGKQLRSTDRIDQSFAMFGRRLPVRG